MLWTKKSKVFVTLCSLLVGILLMFQLRAQANINQGPPKENILQTVMQYDLENAQLKSDNQKLQDELDKYKQGMDASLLANQQLNRAKQIAGLNQVKGPGVEIMLNDSSKKVENQAETALYIVHEGYLRKIVNALWNANAEAIAINGQRITTNSEIFCNGNNILINGQVLATPFVIDAVGDPQTLKALNFTFKYDLGFDNLVNSYGIVFQMSEVRELVLPAAKQRQFTYAVPVKGGK